MNYLNFTPSPPSQSTALLDSGCTAHCLGDHAQCTNKVLAETPLEVILPNGATMASTHTATLIIPSLIHAARQEYILPGLAQKSLLYVGQLCDSGYAVTCTATKVKVTNVGPTILTGQRDKESGLWRVPLETNLPLQLGSEHNARNVYEQKSIQYTITYLYACCFRYVQDTWIKAIQSGHFTTWPCITVENVRKHLQKSDATAKGHMNQICQNICSTKQPIKQPATEIEMVQEDKCNYIYAADMDANQIYTDLTGRFTTTSLSGNK
jgi:hypothetical protein